jgi:hypothetical protein
MRARVIFAVVFLPAISVNAGTQDRAVEPLIIDMRLHAYPADVNGPPPLGLCLPLNCPSAASRPDQADL